MVYDEDTLVITGGYSHPPDMVSKYNRRGFSGYLPYLNTGRYGHACSSYKYNGETFLLVAGGIDPSRSEYLKSTEIFSDNNEAWTNVGDLPHSVEGIAAINYRNTVYASGTSNYLYLYMIFIQYVFTGGYDGEDYFANILKFDPESGEWGLVGSMLAPRAYHAASLVNLEDVRDYCQ